MRTPTNPCKWFGRGGSYDDQEEFVYEGGHVLYYFCPSTEIDEKLFNSWVPISVVFFAKNINHAKDIIERMLNFRLEVNERHEKYLGHEDFSKSDIKELVHTLLKNKDKWIITEAPTNQFYTVGWACNDTIL